MSERYVLDAVALIRILDGDAPMSVKDVYDKAREGNAEILIPAIVIAEIIWILRKRDEHDLIIEVLDDIKDQENTKIVPFSIKIIDEMVKLKETHELHDEIIALTAFIYNADGVCTDDDKLVGIKNLKKIW
ncbi:hypothetical protein BEH94_11400 [Candidatus Altiarchaeales archaeon WOR_SM1_SCG]|nr:hypothetical protein BEH94_11400 [Candidatus Altiarchaeales archaeon WOR_SM1_SCG]